MQGSSFFEQLLKVEKAAIRAFKAAVECKENEKTPALTVTLDTIQAQLGEDFAASQFIDQLSFIKRVKARNDSPKDDPSASKSDAIQLTNLKFVESGEDTITAPRLVSISISMDDSTDLVKEERTSSDQKQSSDLGEKVKQTISGLAEKHCFGHIRFQSCDRYPQPQQSRIELVYSSASHAASLALRKLLLDLEDKSLVEKLSISFLPSLNVSAKPFEFASSTASVLQSSKSKAENHPQTSEAYPAAGSTPMMQSQSEAANDSDVRKNQIAQLYEYYNGLLAQDQIFFNGASKMSLPRFGNPHHFAQAPLNQQAQNLHGEGSLKAFGRVQRNVQHQVSSLENILVSDEAIISAKRSLSRGRERSVGPQMMVQGGPVDDKKASMLRKYSTKEILSIFKMCGRFQSPLEHPQPYGDKMNLDVLTQLLTKKPQVVLEHMRQQRDLPLMAQHSAEVTNKLLLNFTGQQPLVPSKAKTQRV